MTNFLALRNLPAPAQFKKGDVFVLFGELFGRGYANGLIDMAKKAGMTLVGATVGRREEDQTLRALNTEELATAEENLGGKIINVPLQAGFDLEPIGDGETVENLINGVKLTNFQEFKFDWAKVEAARKSGTARFKASVQEFSNQLAALVPEGANVFFAHTMAGGVPRARSMAPITNRVFKGTGKRYVSADDFWKSDLGKLMAMNFLEVTANTFGYLLSETEGLREKIKAWGGEVRYSAYGYHGVEILIGDKYQWETYVFYAQGDAKCLLEKHAQDAWKSGIKATVYNCPETRTNSTDIFPGVELPLYALFKAFKKEGGGAWAEEQLDICQAKLKEGLQLEDFLKKIEEAYQGPLLKQFWNFETWPALHTQEYAELMIGLSNEMAAAHEDKKDHVTNHLSSLIVESTGELIFNYAWNPEAPVVWLNHDVIAKDLIQSHKK